MERISKISENKIILAVILCFIFLFLSHGLIIPPFEGFDESAHYSYISLLSDRWQIPDFRTTLFDVSIDNTLTNMPRRYSGTPPYDSVDGITYYQFFNDLTDPERKRIGENYWDVKQYVSYQPGKEINWQGQHPPLYYLIMILPYRLLSNSTPAARILIFRLLSILLAWGSLFFWFRTIQLFKLKSTRRLLITGGVIAAFLPSLSYDLARIGNDSLVALLFAGVFYFLMLSYINKQRSLANYWYIAILTGLGLWTKLFFLPVLIGIAAFTLWLAIVITRLNWKDITYRLAILIGIPFLIAGAWFLFYNQRYGMFLGGAEFYHLKIVADSGNEGLVFLPFIKQVVRGTAAFIATFLWSGTWSMVHRPLWQYSFMLPFFLMMFYGIKQFFQAELCEEKKQILVASLFILIPLLAGFFYHVITRVRLTGFGAGTGGYYLFFAWLVIGILFSFSLTEYKSYLLKILTLVVFGFVLYFNISGYWFEAQVYSGIIVKAGDIKTGIGYLPLTFSNLSMVINRLQYFTLPVWAFIFYLGAIILQLFLLVTIVFGKWVDVLSSSNPPQVNHLQQYK